MLVRSLEFKDYKSFSDFKISAKPKNVLVGPNNTGKSTSLDALRIAFDVLRFANRRTAFLQSHDQDGVCATYKISQSVIQTDLRYCVRNFDDGHASIRVVGDNGNTLVLKISPDEDALCYLVSTAVAQRTTAFLKKNFPLNITIVPTLSPLEQNEEIVTKQTIEKNQYSRLASRNFRNYWLHQSDQEFDAFSDLVELGWPGVRVRKPEIDRTGPRPVVRMYFRDGPNVREIQWAGFGFQVWMQTMTHLLRADHSSVLVLDEPDIYLHPDLQHRLLKIVSQRVGQFFIATHSTELINDVDPGDVLIVRPNSRSAKRIRSEGDYAEVFDAIGSSENAQFARLARTRRVLYFEGHDNRLLRKIATQLGGFDYLATSDVTLMKTDGFSNWAKVSTTSWVFNEFFDFKVEVAALFDRDNRCEDEIADFIADVVGAEVNCHVLPVKELENLVLIPRAILEVVARYSRLPLVAGWREEIEEKINSIVDSFKDDVVGQRVGNRIKYELSKKPKSDIPTMSASETAFIAKSWADVKFKFSVVPGKRALSLIAKYIQDQFGVTLTASRIIDEARPEELPAEVFGILRSFKDQFEK